MGCHRFNQPITMGCFITMELAKLFYVPVLVCSRQMAVEEGMFVDITDKYSDIIIKHYKRNIGITFGAGLWKTLGHVQKNSLCTYTEIIDKLVMDSRRCVTRFLSEDMVSFRFTLDHINQMELWALAGQDHLGRSSIHMFLPSEEGHMQFKCPVPRRNHCMAVSI